MARQPTVSYDDDAPELTEAELAEFRPAHEVHTPEEFAALNAVRKRGRPFAANPKVPVTIRLDAETAAKFRATGHGWQSRVSALLTRVALEGDATGYVRPAKGGQAATFRLPTAPPATAQAGKAKARA